MWVDWAIKKELKEEIASREARMRLRGYWHKVWLAYRRNKAALAGSALALLLILSAIFAPALALHDPGRQFANGLTDFGEPVPPNSDFLLGTDELGRDVLSRLLWGGRVSLSIGVISNFLAVALAVTAGTVAGYVSGLIETLIMRFIDILMGFPVLLLSVGLVAILNPSPLTIILVIAFVNWTYLGRIIYNMVRSIAEREFILAARSTGVSGFRILTRHILPQLASIIVVYASLGIATSVMLESTLSYVGLGVQPPTPSWGSMINEGQRFYRTAPWLVLYPGAFIASTVLAFNLMGDGLRDALDPYSARKV